MVSTPRQSKKLTTRTDWLGIIASVACAIHCAMMPFIVSYLPALGLGFLADEFFHKVMVFVCFTIALYAFIPGLKQHKKLTPVLFGVFGLMFISVAAFGVEDDCCVLPKEGEALPACCIDECENESETAFQVVISDDDETSGIEAFLGKFALWITPIGGVFLVVGHLLNKKFGHDCNCCSLSKVE